MSIKKPNTKIEKHVKSEHTTFFLIEKKIYNLITFLTNTKLNLFVFLVYDILT